jgi:uncharacterized membrane protein YtjA (UPF0391 family)
MIVSSRFLAV